VRAKKMLLLCDCALHLSSLSCFVHPCTFCVPYLLLSSLFSVKIVQIEEIDTRLARFPSFRDLPMHETQQSQRKREREGKVDMMGRLKEEVRAREGHRGSIIERLKREKGGWVPGMKNGCV